MNVSASINGLFAAQHRYDAAAAEIAKAGADAAGGEAQPPGTLPQITPLTRPGDSATAAEGPSSVSLVTAMTEVTAAQHTYGANAQVLRSMVDTQGKLFDQRV